MAPQAATCLLAATILVTVPAGPARAEPSKPAMPQEPAASSTPVQARTAVVAEGRPQIDAVTLRKVKAYKKYRSKIARQKKRAKVATKFARKQIGKPYSWGATGPGAYDCSGLVMKSWRKADVRLPRVTYSQYRAVDRKVSRKKLRRGDLVFFSGRGHVGMYLSKNRFIHAPSTGKRIRIDKLSGYRKRLFAGAVRPGAPDVKKFPKSIIRIARELDGQDKVANQPEQTGAKAETPASLQKAAVRPFPSAARPFPSGGPEPRPMTTAHAPDSGDMPLPSRQPLEDAVPETTFTEDEAPPGL